MKSSVVKYCRCAGYCITSSWMRAMMVALEFSTAKSSIDECNTAEAISLASSSGTTSSSLGVGRGESSAIGRSVLAARIRQLTIAKLSLVMKVSRSVSTACLVLPTNERSDDVPLGDARCLRY